MPTYYSAAWVLFGIFSVPVSCTRFAANLLTQMFMRLGRAEKAGSGVDKIVSGWQSLGWPLPTVAEETRPDYVVLTLQLGMKTRQENPTRKSNKQVLRREQILEFCVEPKSLFDILQHLGLKNRENLMEVYINPMIGAGALAMTEPDNPTSRNQMYVAVREDMDTCNSK